MNTAKREREQFEALVAAYRQLPKADPAPELDRAILAAARAALGRERPQRPRWPALLATAATFTLAIGLAWQLRDQDLRTQAPAGGEMAPASVPTPNEEGDYANAQRAGAPVAATSVTGQTSPRAAENQEQAKSLHAASEKADDAPARARAQAAAPVPSAPAVTAARKPPSPATTQDRRQNETYRAEERQEVFAAPMTAPASEMGSPTKEAAPELAPEPFPLEEPAPAASAPPAPVPAAPEAAGPPLPAQAPPEASGVLLKRSAADFDSSDPAAWIEDIRHLLRHGQRERAREQLEAFRKALPNAEIPDDLRDLAR